MHPFIYDNYFVDLCSGFDWLYDAALLTMCYTEHALWPYIDSEINLIKLKSYGFLASTYDFSTLYITLPHSLIKEKLTKLIR